MSDSTPTVVRLKSPYNNEVFPMEFVPGRPPTLEAMLTAGYTRVDATAPVHPAPKPKVSK